MSEQPRILVLGASGMLGHEALRVLARDFEVWGACRDPGNVPDVGVPQGRMVGGLDATDHDAIPVLLASVRPDVVINAVGIVKQRDEARAAVPSIMVNSVWPHVVADACEATGARLVHVSTDCVFSGSRGGYRESDVPDASDLYGRSKLLGEVTNRDHAVTLRTSIIGWQTGEPTGLAGWFAAHRTEALNGYRRAIFSGLTTRVLTETIRDAVLPDRTLHGLWHVSAESIDKHTLLCALAAELGWDVDITPRDEPAIDRSLDSSRFRARTGWTPPSWDRMLADLAAEYPGA